MLVSGGGDCYGFACTFAAMAREIGYNPYVVLDVYPVPEMVQEMALPVMAGSLLTDATMIRRHSLQDGTEVYTEAAATTSIIRLRAL